MLRYGLIFILFIFILSSINAIEITEIDSETITVVDPNASSDVQILQRLNSIENKLNNIPDDAEITQGLTELVTSLAKFNKSQFDYFILISTMTIIFCMGMCWAIFLYFKSKGWL